MAESFVVGDFLLKKNGVFVIKQVEESKSDNGDVENVFHYEPYFQTRSNETLRCKVSESNLKKVNIRKPVPKKSVAKFLQKLAEQNGLSADNSKMIALQLEETLNNNSGLETFAKPIAQLWNKQQTKDKFAYTQKRLLEVVIMRLQEEIAVVLDIDLEQAQLKIEKALQA